MNTSFVEKLCCPQDKEDLQLTVFGKVDENVIEGLLTCPACRRYYPIVYGIPIMTPDDYREKALEEPLLKKWGLQLKEHEKKFMLTE